MKFALDQSDACVVPLCCEDDGLSNPTNNLTYADFYVALQVSKPRLF